jgi:hypothetical protein
VSFQLYGKRATGEVIVEDQRPDGSVVMLVCSEFANRSAGPSATTRPAPTGQDSSDDEPVAVVTSSTKDGGVYPLLSETGKVSRRLPKLHVDTTDMPGGILRFAMGIFGRKAMETAEEGYREIRLTPESAPEWGYIPPDPPPAQAGQEEPSPYAPMAPS